MGKMKHIIGGILEDRNVIIASNRSPYRIRRIDGKACLEKQDGGLIPAIEPILKYIGGVWIGCEGGNMKAGGEKIYDVPVDRPRYGFLPVKISPRERRGYYDGFSMKALWPLCHYAAQSATFSEDDYRLFSLVNRRVADEIVGAMRENPLIWVHDFHLPFIARHVHEKVPGVPLAYFWHIPFPPPEVFRALPWREEFLDHVAHYDLIGFHTDRYALNFLHCIEEILGIRVDFGEGGFRYRGRKILVGVFPIGVDFEAFDRLVRRQDILAEAGRIRERCGAARVGLGISHMYRSKGILEQLSALEKFFERFGEYCGKFVFIMIVTPGGRIDGGQSGFRRQILDMAKRINHRFGTSRWKPIRLHCRRFSQQELIPFYIAADMVMVAPLRDGMNLVAKEYVACRSEEDGNLLLSEFTGAAGDLGEADLINPYDSTRVAVKIGEVLGRGREEERRNMCTLRKKVKSYDLYYWLESFLWRFKEVELSRLTVSSIEETA